MDWLAIPRYMKVKSETNRLMQIALASIDAMHEQGAKFGSFKAGAEWADAHPSSDNAWKIYNFINAYKSGEFGVTTLQDALDKHFKTYDYDKSK